MHLEQCEDCRALLADLRRIRDAAGSLEELQPPDRVWLQIAGRLRQEGRLADTTASAAPRPLLCGTAGAGGGPPDRGGGLVGAALAARSRPRVRRCRRVPRRPASGNPAPAASVEDVENELRQAEQHYESAIARLEQITNSDQTMDPAGCGDVEEERAGDQSGNRESRAALRTEPTSAPARGALFEALRQKVTMLQDTIALMNEMRKGNSAARRRSLNKS